VLVKPTNELKAHLRSRGPSLIEAAAPVSEQEALALQAAATAASTAAAGGRGDDPDRTYNGPGFTTGAGNNGRTSGGSSSSSSSSFGVQGTAGRGPGPSTATGGGGAGAGGLNAASITAAQEALAGKISFRIRDMSGSTLDLSNLHLSAVPGYLATQVLAVPLGPGLSTVNLSANALQALPLAELRQLPALRSLLLADNKLGAGMAKSANPCVGVAEFPELTSIDVSKNELSGDQFIQLLCDNVNPAFSNLTEIIATNNPLRSIPNSELAIHGHLQVLRLSYCRLSSLQLDFRYFPHLKSLDVSNNALTTLGVSAHLLHNLEYLNVENNNISEIPLEWAMLPKIKVLLIAGNPQRSVRPQVIAQGSVKVIEWLRSKCQQQQQLHQGPSIAISTPMSVPATTGTQRSATSLASYAPAPVPAPVPIPAFSHAYEAARATVSAMEEASAYYPAPSSSSSSGGGSGGGGGDGERFRSQFALEQYGQQQRSSFETSSRAGRSAPAHPPLATARGGAGRGGAPDDSTHSHGGASNLQYGPGARSGGGGSSGSGSGGGAGAGTGFGARLPSSAGEEPVDAFSQPQYGAGRRPHQQQQYRTSSMGSLLSHDPAPAPAPVPRPAPAGSGARGGPGYYSSAGRR
jgi:hypothetical protein